MPFELPQLEYSYDALEPYIDAQTMEIHHSKHHQAYTNKFNDALKDYSELAKQSAEEIITNLSSVPKEIRLAVKNNGGGYVNHSIFWETLTPLQEKKEISGTNLAKKIIREFDNHKQFKEIFTQTAVTHFGSGWAWLILDNKKRLQITTTVNQDNPLTDGNSPILALDLWEHAYYLKYQNRRPEFIEAWWRVVNWKKADELYQLAMNK